MNIILGKENADEIREKYPVLELDTLMIDDQPVTAYCVVEMVSLDEIALLPHIQGHHEQLIENYKSRKWDQVLNDVESLRTHWRGELDSFYDIIEQRCREYLANDPGPDWTPVLNKNPV